MDSRYLQDKEDLKQAASEVDEDRRAFLTAGLVGGAVAAGTLAAGVAHAQQQVAQARVVSHLRMPPLCGAAVRWRCWE